MRFTLAVTASVSDVIWTEDRIQSSRNFANKIWNAARFLFVNLDRFEESGPKLEELAAPEMRAKAPYACRGLVPLVDEWLFGRLMATTSVMNTALANYRFHEAAQVIYQFFWGDFCDWYIEWIKPELQNSDRERAVVAWKNLFAAFDRALRLLHPFMPFLTEELWHQLPQRPGDKSIALSEFPQDQPKHNGDFVAGERVNEFTRVQEVITHVRNIRAELKLDSRKKVAAEVYSSHNDIREEFARNLDGILRLAILSDLTVSAEQLPQEGGVVRSTSLFDVRIAYSDRVDVVAEKTRLKKEIEGLQKAVASKERQLGDEIFRSRAPETIIKGLEATLAEQRIELRKLQDRLSQLEGDA